MDEADLYGASLNSGVPPTATAAASGPATFTKGPAMYLIAIIGVLVFARLLYELAD